MLSVKIALVVVVLEVGIILGLTFIMGLLT